MRSVVFLDRDGVINNDTGHYYIFKPEHFVLNSGLLPALKKLSAAGYEFIVISNQGGIARGTYTKADVEKVHEKMLALFADAGIRLLDVYYCPHHSDIETCLCRKPGSLMIEKAMARFQVDPDKSLLIGDNNKDIKAAQNAGIRGVKIDSNQDLQTLLSQIIGV
jgi:D-glycero-D-manno-heptose 1,7-bisphosphate phosphatase